MKIGQAYNGTIIGAIFTVVSLLLTFTLIIPVFSVIPGALVEGIMAGIVENEPYSNVGKATIAALGGILTLSMVLFLIRSRKIIVTNNHIYGIMIFEYFIIHSLGFYIYWATSLDFRGDGQLIFGAMTSFPVSSFGLLGAGLLIDIVKKRP